MGDLYLAKPGSPAVVTIHRLTAERVEFAPLAERLAKADKRFTVLSFDLRGHGESKAPEGWRSQDLDAHGQGRGGRGRSRPEDGPN